MTKHNFQHTPGPYTWTYQDASRYADGEINAPDGQVLAIVSGSNYGVYLNNHTESWDEEGSTKEHIANARLFAKAPELFDHLETLLKVAKSAIAADNFDEAEKLIEYIRNGEPADE